MLPCNRATSQTATASNHLLPLLTYTSCQLAAALRFSRPGSTTDSCKSSRPTVGYILSPKRCSSSRDARFSCRFRFQRESSSSPQVNLWPITLTSTCLYRAGKAGLGAFARHTLRLRYESRKHWAGDMPQPHDAYSHAHGCNKRTGTCKSPQHRFQRYEHEQHITTISTYSPPKCRLLHPAIIVLVSGHHSEAQDGLLLHAQFHHGVPPDEPRRRPTLGACSFGVPSSRHKVPIGSRQLEPRLASMHDTFLRTYFFSNLGHVLERRSRAQGTLFILKPDFWVLWGDLRVRGNLFRI